MPRHSKRSSSGRPRQPENGALGEVRIIAGQWRGRRMPVANVPGLRPTGDRVRETVFNWLQMSVPGSHCLDLFAGTGALGFEAASRQASSVTFVEASTVAAAQIQLSLSKLEAGEAAQLKPMTASEFLSTNTQPFDIVFVDPPFSENLQLETLTTLIEGHLAPGALVYVEAPKRADFSLNFVHQLEQNAALGCFELNRQKTFGDVTVFLLMYKQ